MSARVERARAVVRDAGGAELAERLAHLDRLRDGARATPPTPPPVAPSGGCAVDFDVAIAGGGLWSLLAPVLAAKGLSVVVVERARAAAAHREWNASGPELEALVRAGLFTAPELAELVVARYDHGVCRFRGGESYPVTGVLDHAVDAGPLLARARRLAEERGVTFLDGHEVLSHASGARAVRVLTRPTGDPAAPGRELTARLLVDARGAASPYATADLVCPTVGGVLRGLAPGDAPDEMNPRVGDILATVDPVVDGRQHVWEAFPGRAGETTVYLFYYARAQERVSLAELFADFFATLPRYKRGDVELVRPTFGLIPGWSRLTPAPRAPERRVVLVGDAASRHSPLTYCGFGATLRSLEPASRAIARGVQAEEPDLGSIVDDAPVHSLTGALAHMMASRAFRGDELNALLDAAFGALAAMGNERYASLLRDEMSPSGVVEFLRRTAARHPAVWGKVARGLGVGTAGRWSLGVASALVRG